MVRPSGYTTACLALLSAATFGAASQAQWRADHHMHLGSARRCRPRSGGATPAHVIHAGGGFPLKFDNHSRVLEVFADHIARDDPLTRRVLFDLSYVPAPEEGEAAISALVLQMRRIGIDRFLFGSDYNVLTPVEAISFIERLGLTEQEQNLLRQSCAPWVCRDTAESSRKSARVE